MNINGRPELDDEFKTMDTDDRAAFGTWLGHMQKQVVVEILLLDERTRQRVNRAVAASPQGHALYMHTEPFLTTSAERMRAVWFQGTDAGGYGHAQLGVVVDWVKRGSRSRLERSQSVALQNIELLTR